MNTRISKEARLLKAKKRVEELKGFYIHFGVYICVNLFLSLKQLFGALDDGLTFSESILELSSLWIWVFWGIGIVSHALKVFGTKLFLGKDWEDRKIKEYME